ncbi:MAG: hypothetical protein KDB53_06120 [Planctomycetes bacterium]|nr:hypothetical protein [Planctomycetota bacterium]
MDPEIIGNRPKNSASTVVTLVVILLLIGLSWRSCWYATPMDDATMTHILSGKGSDGDIQKALLQIQSRGEKGDDSVQEHYEAVVGLADHPTSQIRSTVAWLMGAQPGVASFEAPLRRLLDDSALAVRQNAALGLANRGDASVRPLLLSMLEKHEIRSEWKGVLEDPRAPKSAVRVGQIVARVVAEDGRHDVLAPIDGTISSRRLAHGDPVDVGTLLLVLEPSVSQITNAVVALGRVGTKDDISVLRELIEGPRPLSDDARRYAAKVLQSLQSRED